MFTIKNINITLAIVGGAWEEGMVEAFQGHWIQKRTIAIIQHVHFVSIFIFILKRS